MDNQLIQHNESFKQFVIKYYQYNMMEQYNNTDLRGLIPDVSYSIRNIKDPDNYMLELKIMNNWVFNSYINRYYIIYSEVGYQAYKEINKLLEDNIRIMFLSAIKDVLRMNRIHTNPATSILEEILGE